MVNNEVKKAIIQKLIDDTEFNIVKNDEILKFAKSLNKEEKEIKATENANITNNTYLVQLRQSLNENNN